MLHSNILVILLINIIIVKCDNKTSEVFYEEPSLSDDPKIYYLSSETKISNRYATTVITCKIKNPSVVSKEAVFQMTIPDKAFISNFVMEINNKSYQAFVQEKEKAQKTYETAVEQGRGAAQVKVSTRNSKRFIVNVNLEAEERATFQLTYEELLERNQNQFEVVMNVHPGQLVQNLHIEMIINEEQGFKFVNSPKMRRGNKINAKTFNTNAKIKEIGGTVRIVTFNPDIEEQKSIAKQMETKLEAGISGQLTLTYDVEKKSPGGLLLQNRGYFAHYYTPEDAAVLPKYIIFILDTSGSMSGEKLSQLKSAMNNILSSLNHGDLFNIVEFSSTTKVWDVLAGEITFLEGQDDFFDEYTDEEKIERNVLPSAHVVNDTTIEKAKSVLKLLEPIGGTDIDTALKVGFQLLDKNLKHEIRYQPIILFSTDGDVNNGELDYNTILKSVTTINNDRASIFTLSIGPEANKDFLKKLALRNKGKTGHIYEDNDIAQQFENFFKGFSNPILTNLTVDYGLGVKDTTETAYNSVFRGSEIVIVGKKDIEKDFQKDHQVQMVGESLEGPIKVQPTVKNIESMDMKRLWAYLKVKQLLNQRKISEKNATLTQRALRISMKYSFVTELTSLVVVKPDETKIVELEDASIGIKSDDPSSNTNTGHKFPPDITLGVAEWNSSDLGNSKDPIAVNNTDVAKTLRTQLPWLQNILLENGTIITPQGPIEINLDSTTLGTRGICEIVIDSKMITGECRRFLECNATNNLMDIGDLLRRSCKMETKYTGICCGTFMK